MATSSAIPTTPATAAALGVDSAALKDELTKCGALVQEFLSKPEADPFREAVDWVALHLPDYPEIIKHPMDLGTVRTKLEAGAYNDAYDFAEDCRLIWQNAKRYNTPGSGIYMVAENLSKQFERKFARIRSAGAGRRKRGDVKGKESTHEDRVQFADLVKQITSDQLGKVVEMIDKKCPQALTDLPGEDGIELEIYHLDSDTLTELIAFGRKCLSKLEERGRRKKK